MTKKPTACEVTTEFILRNREKFVAFMQELEEFLKTKLPSNGEYYCLDKTGDDYDARWKMTSRFLNNKGLNASGFFDVIRDEYNMDFICEGDIANGYWRDQLEELDEELAKEGEPK